MAILAELYVAARTRNTSDADTENLPVLVVKRADEVVFTKPLFGGSFRTRRGAGAVWRFDVRDVNLDSADLKHPALGQWQRRLVARARDLLGHLRHPYR
jgi:hypothetical protein